MEIQQYLSRINFCASDQPTIDVLFKIHERHVFTIPFENLSIHCGEAISLHVTDVFSKIIVGNRGGYCYELNSLFHELLLGMGYSSVMVSSRIYNLDGSWGPNFDHLSLVVSLDDKKWLLDVGYGDLFLKPLEVVTNIVQTDGRNYFKMDKDGDDYVLLMSEDKVSFEKRYRFNLSACSIHDFNSLNQVKQTHPESYFTKNLVCSKPTSSGRITLFNSKLICKDHSTRNEETIKDKAHFQSLLKNYFGIELNGVLSYPFLT